MKYYKITNSHDLKIIGKYPQNASGGKIGENINAGEGNYGPIDFKGPITSIFPFHNKAKRTDYIGNSSGSIKMTISPDFYIFLKKYLPEHQVWDIQYSNDVYKMDWKKMDYVVKEGVLQELYPYKVLHISYPNLDFINFEKSEFFLENREKYLEIIGNKEMMKSLYSKKNKKIIKIKSEKEYETLFKGLRKQQKADKEAIIVNKLVLNDINEDIFRILSKVNNTSSYYVSENLKDKIQEKGFTGIDFLPLEEINKNIEIEVV
jgi:hypothetical protein